MSEKYFGYAISIGVKLFTIYLIIGFGDSFTQALKDTIAAAYAAHPEGPSFGDYLGVGGASLLYGVAGYMAPGLAGSMLNGTVAMSLQSAGTAAGMVGGAPVAAGLTASAVGARALGLAGGAMGALLPVQKAAGAICGASAGVGFGGGISGMVNPVNPFQLQLQVHLAINHTAEVWRCFRSWLRTMNPAMPPSELVVAHALRSTMPGFLAFPALAPDLTKIVEKYRHHDPSYE